MPSISVYITSYNQKTYLAEAIESVLSQTLRPREVIIVDDCSIDGSRDLIEGFRGRFPDVIKPIYHSSNAGVARVRIDALEAVTGDFVSSLDGDDRFLPTKLEKEMLALRRCPGARIAFSNNYYINERGERIGEWADGEKPADGLVFSEVFARAFPKRNLFRMELVDYRAWKEVGFHDPALCLYEDYEMRIRLTKKLRTVYCDDLLSEYRFNPGGLSKTPLIKHLEALEYIYRKNSGLLDDLDARQKSFVKKRFFGWMSELSMQAARQSLSEIRIMRSAACCLKAVSYRRYAL